MTEDEGQGQQPVERYHVPEDGPEDGLGPTPQQVEWMREQVAEANRVLAAGRVTLDAEDVPQLPQAMLVALLEDALQQARAGAIHRDRLAYTANGAPCVRLTGQARGEAYTLEVGTLGLTTIVHAEHRRQPLALPPLEEVEHPVQYWEKHQWERDDDEQ
jgi:hypothetical protein